MVSKIHINTSKYTFCAEYQILISIFLDSLVRWTILISFVVRAIRFLCVDSALVC